MFYGWWLAVIGAVIMTIATVPLFQALAIWNAVLAGNFGWTPTQLSWAFALTRVEGSVMGPIAGWGVDKLGPRKMVFIGMLIVGAGFILLGLTKNIWMFYAAFIVLSLGSGLGSWLPANTALNNWFRARRSTAMSIPMVGFGLGGIFIVPLMAWGMGWDAQNRMPIPGRLGWDAQNRMPIPGRLGWEMTAIVVAIVALVSALPLALLIRNRPEDYGQHPDGIAPDSEADTTSRGTVYGGNIVPDYEWREAVRTRAFWCITMGHASSSIIIISVMSYLGLFMVDRGFSLFEISLVVSVQTAVATAFMLIGGLIGDRIPIRLAIFTFSFLQSIAIVILLFADTLPMLFIFGTLMGIGFGGRTPLTTSIRGVYFGRSNFATITGVSMIPMNVLFVVVVPFIGIMKDHITHSYTEPFAVIGAVSAIGSLMFLFLGNPRLSPSQRRRADVQRLVTSGATTSGDGD
jgi:MFS family permease